MFSNLTDHILQSFQTLTFKPQHLLSWGYFMSSDASKLRIYNAKSNKICLASLSSGSTEEKSQFTYKKLEELEDSFMGKYIKCISTHRVNNWQSVDFVFDQ